ncbi:cobyrinate a,c-diamide synthase [Deferrisoma camini]|uniref:cobyrinate a,c-diamide synthase n=1 Tax=Deferrisoma camini TaxID=1035120 RepID=UPI00046D7612|nr:cobyrinate a,c-diamide synthase [Deferrisoma camini]
MRSAFVIAAPWSGSGKTTVTLAVLAALQRRGLRVQAFKVGPDYIDPAHHARITGRPSHNLDTWMIPRAVNRRLFHASAADADVAVVEGVMGLFDGVDGTRPEGSTAHLARTIRLPVVLVVDARSMARSAAALVQGFASFTPRVPITGVVWNRVGSPTHRRILDEALAAAGLPPALGALPPEPGLALPERHLGLVTPEDAALPPAWEDRLAAWIEDHLDLDRLLERTPPPPPPRLPVPRRRAGTRTVAVARDAAFCFYYDENLRLLERAGARIVRFSPLAGDGVPPDADAVYLGGGYPEVHAERLAANQAFLDGLRGFHSQGRPIYAECGGFMVLCRSLETPRGGRVPMAGIFPAEARMRSGRFHLGYREVVVQGVAGMDGLTARGHEFHYSELVAPPQGVETVYRVRNARGEELGREGYRSGAALAGYIHLHFASCPDLPLRWLGLSGPRPCRAETRN